jgi:hypothetical protein
LSMGDLSIFCSLLWFLSLIIYSFPCRSHSHPLLSLFLGILFFEAILNGIANKYWMSKYRRCLLLNFSQNNVMILTV